MNEQRLQAYLNLIDALLSCPSGEEAQILNANPDLVNAGLVQKMLEVANELIKQQEQLFELWHRVRDGTLTLTMREYIICK